MSRSLVVGEEERYSPSYRNTQLWLFLNTIGVHVRPVRVEDEGEEEGELVALVVSSDPMPFSLAVREDSPETGVGLPVQGNQIADVIRPAFGKGDVMVDFPTKG